RIMPGFDAAQTHFHSIAVETKTIDNSQRFGRTEYARFWIARLRHGRNGADFHKPEAEIQYFRYCLGIFIKACRKADGIREFQTAYRCMQYRATIQFCLG